MKLKRILCTALSAAMLCGVAFAAESVPATELTPAAPAYEVKQPSFTPVAVHGKAAEVTEKSIRLENSNDKDPYQKIILNITEDTIILDAVTGQTKKLADVKAHESLYAYASPVMTRSIPPQSAAVLVLCNIPADYRVPTYAEIQSISTKEDGTVSALMTGDIVLHMNKDTVLTPYLTKNNLTPADLQPGMKLLSWYSFAAMSMPAQATPTKVLVFPSAYAGYAAMTDKEISVNGKALTATPYAENGKLMVPVRAFAEALGCTVTWDAKAPTAVTVEKDGTVLYTVTLNADTLVYEKDMTRTLATAAVAKSGTTYLCADDLWRSTT